MIPTDNDYRIGATRCHFLEIHCKVVDYIFLCGKRNSNNKKYVYGNRINRKKDL